MIGTPAPESDPLLTCKQVAELAAVSVGLVRVAIGDGELHPERWIGGYRTRRSEAQRWIDFRWPRIGTESAG